MIRRVIYLILSLILILVSVNFWIRNTHIRNIENAINKIEKSFADLGITLEILHKNFHNLFFWNVYGELENVEAYATVSDCVLYFKIPQIEIVSSLNSLYNIETKILLPSNLKGYIDMNDMIANKIGMQKKYDILMASPNNPLFVINTTNIFSETLKTMSFILNDLSIDVRDKDSTIQKIMDFSNIKITFEDLTKIKSFLTGNLNNINIYLSPEIVVKNLPKDLSIDDASKNISLQLEFINENDKKYDGSFNVTTRAFEFHIDGQDEKVNRKHKSDLNFKIKNFKVFINYLTSLAVSAKEENRENILEMSQILQNNIDKNSRKENNYTLFKIKDEEKQVLFEGKPIEMVFQDFLRRLHT